MAKIRLTIDLDVGDYFSPENFQLDPEFKKGLNKLEQDCLRDALIGDALGYAYVGFVTNQHYAEAVEWCARGHIGSENEDKNAVPVYQHHKLWGDIAKTATFKWKFI